MLCYLVGWSRSHHTLLEADASCDDARYAQRDLCGLFIFFLIFALVPRILVLYFFLFALLVFCLGCVGFASFFSGRETVYIICGQEGRLKREKRERESC